MVTSQESFLKTDSWVSFFIYNLLSFRIIWNLIQKSEIWNSTLNTNFSKMVQSIFSNVIIYCKPPTDCYNNSRLNIIFQIFNILPWTTSKNAQESTSSLIVSAEQESLYLEGSMVHSPLSFSFQQCQGHPVELLEKTLAKRKTKNFITLLFLILR